MKTLELVCTAVKEKRKLETIVCRDTMTLVFVVWCHQDFLHQSLLFSSSSHDSYTFSSASHPPSLVLSPLGVMSQVTEWSCNLELAPCGRSSKFSLCQIFTITVARCCDISQCLLQRLAERTSYFHYFIYFFIKVGQGIQSQERSRENRDTDEEERRCSIVLAVWVPANDQFLKTFCLWVNVQPIRCEDFLLTFFPPFASTFDRISWAYLLLPEVL